MFPESPPFHTHPPLTSPPTSLPHSSSSQLSTFLTLHPPPSTLFLLSALYLPYSPPHFLPHSSSSQLSTFLSLHPTPPSSPLPPGHSEGVCAPRSLCVKGS
ncbi:hypothetical protein Pmani_029938 [Petrolisthes manimaculis]|uniref:Uncharacterized protein n=1 Tax=Petrolisthes manimaculis TaxID=1843537 RepID=A0AAE1TTE2_9EUCA|nr:hypothetical protein Pmani_029938 [Petrolisthes manimaculis]